MRSTRTLLAALALASTSLAQIQFVPLTTIDLDSTANPANPEYIGTNPSAVAWDGADLVIAGFNGSGVASRSALVRVSNALSTPTLGAAFGINAATPASRGYSGIAAQGGQVAAAYDSGATIVNGIALYNSDGSLAWQIGTSAATNVRGMCGVDFDPGFGGVDFGLNYLEQGGGRRRLANTATGALIYNSSNGAIINFTTVSTGWRDHVFNPANGDLYTRVNNDVGKHTRAGGNSFSPNVRIIDVTDASGVAGQNIEFLDTPTGDFLIYNDRPSTATVPLTTAVRIIDTSGVAQPYNLGPGFSAVNATGYYDFSWDGANDRLAILDFTNRKVYLFELCSGADGDFDGVLDCLDNCPSLANPSQADCDNDGVGDVCEIAGGAFDTNSNSIPDTCEFGVVIPYCTAGLTSNGCVPALSASGAPSAAALSGFTLSCSGLEGQRIALGFYGVNGPQAAPWGGGSSSFNCVVSPIKRLPRINTGGTAGACDGAYSVDFLDYVANNPGVLGTPLTAGGVFNAQVWFRDPAAPTSTNLSDALQWTMAP